MKSFSVQTGAQSLNDSLKNHVGIPADLLLVFTTRDILRETDVLSTLNASFPNAQILGCSTSGEIGAAGVEDDSIAIMGLAFDHSRLKCARVRVDGADNSRNAGQQLAKELMADDLAGIFVLSPGTNINGSKLTLGLKDVLPPQVSISGGLAGDGLAFSETLTVFNQDTHADHVVAFGLYGPHVHIRSGARGGWKPFGPIRRVTRAKDNVLYELDGESALDLYRKYLGDKASELPSSGLLYPFAIMDGDNKDASGLIRTILNIDEAENSLILAGDLTVGQHVCLMHANTDELIDGAERAALEAMGGMSCDGDNAIICVSCVGRKILMGDDTEDELDVVRDVFGSKSKIGGFYSYGEISNFEDTGEPELHNQTMTITYIHEDAA